MPYPPLSPDDTANTKAFIIAFVMAGLAGHVNSVMLLAFGLPVSQMTGTASHLSEGMALANASVVITTLIILAGFIAGATVSGLMIGRRGFPDSPRYAWALALESLLLGAAVACIMLDRTTGALALAAIACGLQNALVASYRGLLIRTTHITGIATDLGVYIARLIRRQGWTWEGSLLIILIVGYVSGGIAGVMTVTPLGTAASLALPALGTALIALLAWVYRRRLQS